MDKKDIYKYIDDHKHEDICLYVRDHADKAGGEIIIWGEGTGDNLLREDIREGYVDYIDYCTYRLNYEDRYEPEFIEDDDGMILLRKLYQKMTGEEIFFAIKDMIIIPYDAELCILE